MLPLGPIQIGQVVWSGFITGRHVTRSSRHHITLLVNQRNVHSRGLLAAFEQAYRPLLPRGRHPIAVLFLSLPRTRIDVNVHPSKAEVKIIDEAAVAAALQTGVRELLGRSLGHGGPDDPELDASFAFGLTQLELPAIDRRPRIVAEGGPEWHMATRRRLRQMRVAGHVARSLILLEDEQGVYLIDQHRAHERAIYELLLQQHVEGRAGQMLLEPLHVELSQVQISRLEPRLPELAALGFACEWFGGRSFLVRSIPVLPETAELPMVIDGLLELATEDDSDWQHRLLTSVSCRAATRRGRSLTLEQCRELVALLAETESPAACPHGSPIILHFSEQFLERQFQW
jgi:DNA mismatch repair protein MutL